MYHITDVSKRGYFVAGAPAESDGQPFNPYAPPGSAINHAKVMLVKEPERHPKDVVATYLQQNLQDRGFKSAKVDPWAITISGIAKTRQEMMNYGNAYMIISFGAMAKKGAREAIADVLRPAIGELADTIVLEKERDMLEKLSGSETCVINGNPLASVMNLEIAQYVDKQGKEGRVGYESYDSCSTSLAMWEIITERLRAIDPKGLARAEAATAKNVGWQESL